MTQKSRKGVAANVWVYQVQNLTVEGVVFTDTRKSTLCNDSSGVHPVMHYIVKENDSLHYHNLIH